MFGLTWLTPIVSSDTYRDNYGTAIICAISIVDIIFNILLFGLFLKRIYLVIQNKDEILAHQLLQIDKKRSIIDENDLESIEQLGSMNEMFLHRSTTEENEVINIVSKILCLTIISEIFQHIWYLMLILTIVAVERSDYSFKQWIFLRLVRSVTIVSNSFALYLSFVFNQRKYNCCCMVCHNGIKNCCIQQINKYRNQSATNLELLNQVGYNKI